MNNKAGMLYCSCVKPTSHSSGLMADGSSPIVCQECGREMFIEGIKGAIGILKGTNNG